MSPVRSDLEDFAPIVDATRRGAHRARPSLASELLPVASVVVVIAVVTAVVLVVLGGGGSKSKGDDAAASTATSPTVKTSAPATTAAQQSEEPTQEPTVSDEPTSDGAGSGEVDKAVKFTVLNDTDTSGLAKKAATKLSDAGWTATAATGNTSPKGRYDASVVYYKTDDDEAAAQQIASDLGISEVTKSSTKSKTTPVTVILGKDYKP